MITTQVRELLLQSLTHERGGVLVYRTALECAKNDELREEWQKYLDQTENHVKILRRALTSLGLDPGEMTPGCMVVEHMGKSLVQAMKMALASDPAAAELVACDCVVLAETKDHANWQLIGECAKAMEGDAGTVLKGAYEQVEDQEDEHLYHTKGWCRELWLQSLGLDAKLPPPEEKKDVKDAVAAAKVAAERKKPEKARKAH
jgi:rubrerythrin